MTINQKSARQQKQKASGHRTREGIRAARADSRQEGGFPGFTPTFASIQRFNHGCTIRLQAYAVVVVVVVVVVTTTRGTVTIARTSA